MTPLTASIAVDFERCDYRLLALGQRDAAAAERFLAKALGGENHPAPRVINTDKHAAFPPAIAGLRAAGDLADNCQHRPVQYLNNVLESGSPGDQASDQRESAFSLLLGSLAHDRRLLYEAIHMIRKGQACWRAAGAKAGLLHRFIVGKFGLEV